MTTTEAIRESIIRDMIVTLDYSDVARRELDDQCVDSADITARER